MQELLRLYWFDSKTGLSAKQIDPDTPEVHSERKTLAAYNLSIQISKRQLARRSFQ
ncbi:hypothetical protein QNI19_17200 [Cytophagaceae bacterium DM2B3-1]|uniref:Biopterin-dependent aromatic amino acid hydroxylase family profile domain-containing protein n=2 Tax=Xanthocytophaga TaxID=3078918 RepID=A0ABT7CLW2_9BACT|nr:MULTISPECIES: hypothetical protein [Xanthocytophaga]MDJ1494680.1 hypothetical protein [Xanthocytophaga flavus]MDJ1505136.1 hypothetical protein [Xanthocytophaga agilis]